MPSNLHYLTVNDNKQRVREKLGLKGEEKDGMWRTFEFEAGEAAREAKFDAKITWSDIDESAKAAAISRIKGRCEKLGLGQGELMEELAEWKLWQIHRVARKPVLFGSKDRPVQQAAAPTQVVIKPRPKPYDPVRDC
ncbi:hypothetical protein MMC31_000351 [Peltigera leucophlebia]|nr:hypothetical protein [Peltigera leucophlebia]